MRASALVRSLDLIVLALALPVFLVADLSLLGYAVCTGAWLSQRVLKWLIARRASATGSPRAAAGALALSMVGRVWVVALAILIAGLADRDAGLPAAVLAAIVFQVWFTAEMLTRGLGRREAR